MAYNNIIDFNSYNKNIYILGTAEFGKTNAPTLIKNETQLRTVYGNKGTIVEGFLQAKGGSLENSVYAVKVNGTHSAIYLNANISKGSVVEKCIIFKAKYSNEVYNNIKLLITETSIIFVFPQELGGGYKQYTYADYEIFGLLMRQINEDTNRGDNMVYMQCAIEPSTTLANSLFSVNKEEIYMSGGYSGLNFCKDNYFYNLENTYNLLEGESIDVITPLGACIDDIDPSNLDIDINDAPEYYAIDRDYLTLKYADTRPASFYEQLMLFCIKQLRGGTVTSGVIGFNKTNDKTLAYIDSTYFSKVLVPSINANKTNKDIEEYQQLVSVVAGDLQYNFGDAVVNGCVIYSGLLGSINSSVNSTNQAFGNSILLYNEFEETTMNALASIGIVTFRHSVLKDRVVPMNGVTSISHESDTHYYCNVRMVQLTMAAINELINSYMGESVSNLIDNKIMNQDLDSLIVRLTTTGVIDKCEYSISKNELDSTVSLSLNIKTRYMIEGIKKYIGIGYNT